MADKNQWLIDQLKTAKAKESSFIKRSLLQADIDLIAEQQQRIVQAQSELDGRAWSKAEW